MSRRRQTVSGKAGRVPLFSSKLIAQVGPTVNTRGERHWRVLVQADWTFECWSCDDLVIPTLLRRHRFNTVFFNNPAATELFFSKQTWSDVRDAGLHLWIPSGLFLFIPGIFSTLSKPGSNFTLDTPVKTLRVCYASGLKLSSLKQKWGW